MSTLEYEGESFMTDLGFVPIAIVIVAVTISGITDIWKHRVYNMFTFPLMVSGALYHAVAHGWDGLGSGFLGMLFGFGVLIVPLYWFVHCGLEYCYLRFAVRYCTNRGLDVSRLRCRPWFKDSIKTEYTLVELDCVDSNQRRKLVRLLVWLFGIRKVLSVEESPDEPEAKKA